MEVKKIILDEHLQNKLKTSKPDMNAIVQLLGGCRCENDDVMWYYKYLNNQGKLENFDENEIKANIVKGFEFGLYHWVDGIFFGDKILKNKLDDFYKYLLMIKIFYYEIKLKNNSLKEFFDLYDSRYEQYDQELERYNQLAIRHMIIMTIQEIMIHLPISYNLKQVLHWSLLNLSKAV